MHVIFECLLTVFLGFRAVFVCLTNDRWEKLSGKVNVIFECVSSQKCLTSALSNTDGIGEESEVISWGSSGIFGNLHDCTWTGRKTHFCPNTTQQLISNITSMILTTGKTECALTTLKLNSSPLNEEHCVLCKNKTHCVQVSEIRRSGAHMCNQEKYSF